MYPASYFADAVERKFFLFDTHVYEGFSFRAELLIEALLLPFEACEGGGAGAGGGARGRVLRASKSCTPRTSPPPPPPAVDPPIPRLPRHSGRTGRGS